MLKIQVLEIAGKEVLSGKATGQALLPKLIAALPGGSDGAPVLVDFSGVEVVTASCFREAFLAFRDYALRSRGTPIIFVSANDEIAEEVQLLAHHVGEAFVFGQIQGENVVDGTVLGQLENKQALALQMVAELGETDAKRLQERAGEDTGITVWNNRLASLNKKGLLIERVEGRSKYYRTVIGDLTYGK